jgi:hypothetical protein
MPHTLRRKLTEAQVQHYHEGSPPAHQLGKLGDWGIPFNFLTPGIKHKHDPFALDSCLAVFGNVAG